MIKGSDRFEQRDERASDYAGVYMIDDMFKILLFMKRRHDISVEAFRDYYETRRAPLAARYGQGITRYIRRYIDPQPHPETGPAAELPFDVITELWFDDEQVFDAALAFITSAIMPKEITDDEAQLFDRGSFRIATVVEREFARPIASGEIVA